MKYLMIILSMLLIVSCDLSNSPADSFLHTVESNTKVYLSGIIGFEEEISETTNYSRFAICKNSDGALLMALEHKPSVKWLLDVKELSTYDVTYNIPERGVVKCIIGLGSIQQGDPLEVSYAIVTMLRDLGYHVEELELE